MIIVGIIVLFLLTLHLTLPPIIKWAVNNYLNDVNGFSVTIDDVDLAIIRGGVNFEGVDVQELATETTVPFVYIDVADILFDWSALFHGKIVCEVKLDSLEVNFVQRPGNPQDTSRVSMVKQLAEVPPLKVNLFEVKNGHISYKDFQAEPDVDIDIRDLYLKAENLSNAVAEEDTLPGKIFAEGTTIGGGALEAKANVNVMKEPADFDFNLNLEGADLVELNNFFQAYGKFDFQQGTISVVMEMAAADGIVDGYVKPELKNFDVIDKQEREEQGFFRNLYERIVGAGTKVLSVKEDKLATQIPIEGSIEGPTAQVIPTLYTLVKNAWVEGLSNSLENSINYHDAVDRQSGDDGGSLLKAEEDN